MIPLYVVDIGRQHRAWQIARRAHIRRVVMVVVAVGLNIAAIAIFWEAAR